MSNIATAGAESASNRLSITATVFALATVLVWLFAATVNDGFYVLAAALGLAAVGVSAKARTEARRNGSKGRLALAAMIVGGFIAAAVIVYSAVYGISKLV
jgi:hypothetical protein